MKTYFTFFAILCALIGQVRAVEVASYRFHNRILAIQEAGPPEVFDDSVIFTATGAERIGIAFNHEGYAKIHWFKRLYKPIARMPEDIILKNPLSDKEARYDSGILFYTYAWPAEMQTLEYRMIIDGVWTKDPWNPNSSVIATTGIQVSRVRLADIKGKNNYDNLVDIRMPPRELDKGPRIRGKSVEFSFANNKSNEHISIAGSFNAWDPFMYELRETEPGLYTIILELPKGSYYYLFYKDGQALLDDTNPAKVYASDGRAVSHMVVP